jgi:AcrR family transcriptional regulator
VPERQRRLSPDAARARAARSRRRPRLSHDAIVTVALRIVDTEGVDEVSMRRVAAEFDTGPASLYAYFANKDELLRAVLDRVIESMAAPAGDDWCAVVRSYAHAVHETLAAHRDIAKLTFAHIPSNDRVFEVSERILAAMIGGGVPPRVAAWSVDVLALYIAADAYEGYLASQRFTAADGAEIGEQIVADIVGKLRAASPDAFPFLVKYADVLTSGTPDERFAFGIDLLIAGVAAQVPPRRQS